MKAWRHEVGERSKGERESRDFLAGGRGGFVEGSRRGAVEVDEGGAVRPGHTTPSQRPPGPAGPATQPYDSAATTRLFLVSLCLVDLTSHAEFDEVSSCRCRRGVETRGWGGDY
jgi:hypothetical protein